jgi:hypothetical protein
MKLSPHVVTAIALQSIKQLLIMIHTQEDWQDLPTSEGSVYLLKQSFQGLVHACSENATE